MYLAMRACLRDWLCKDVIESYRRLFVWNRIRQFNQPIGLRGFEISDFDPIRGLSICAVNNRVGSVGCSLELEKEFVGGDL